MEAKKRRKGGLGVHCLSRLFGDIFVSSQTLLSSSISNDIREYEKSNQACVGAPTGAPIRAAPQQTAPTSLKDRAKPNHVKRVHRPHGADRAHRVTSVNRVQRSHGIHKIRSVDNVDMGDRDHHAHVADRVQRAHEVNIGLIRVLLGLIWLIGS